MKAKVELKGFRLSFRCVDNKQNVTIVDGIETRVVEPVEILNTEFEIGETNEEVEMDQEEFKHLHTTLAASAESFREKIAQPFLDKIFTCIDNATIILDKKIMSEIKIKEMRANQSMETPEAR